ncbi:hypothetical protein H0H92_003778 [Tricholoma furcatifolium]|nr:hypothetical protein H0H92_003778 [Tricholoma furcatifolium]
MLDVSSNQPSGDEASTDYEGSNRRTGSKRKRVPSRKAAYVADMDCSDDSEDDSDSDDSEGSIDDYTEKAKTTKRRPIPTRKQKALLQNQHMSPWLLKHQHIRLTHQKAHLKLAKIRKAIQLATHPGTGEHEAKVAMHMATELMATQNITQADLIASETEEERATRAGHSTVEITPTSDKEKMMRFQHWYHAVTDASCEAFDVQVYSEMHDTRSSLKWVFYGLADNTVAAALAFEMLHNQIELCVLKEVEEANHQAVKQAQLDEKRRRKEEIAAAEAARAAEIARLARSTQANVKEEQPQKVTIEDVPDESMKSSSRLPEPDEDSDAENAPSSNYDGPHLHDGLHADFDNDHNSTNDMNIDRLDELEKRIDARTRVGLLIKQEPPSPRVKAEPTEGTVDAKTTADLSIKQVPLRSPTVKEEPLEAKIDTLDIGRKSDSPAEDTPLQVKDEPVVADDALDQAKVRVKTELEDEELIPMKEKMKGEHVEVSMSNSNNEAPHWTSALQLRTFRKNAKAIADTYLTNTLQVKFSYRRLGEIKFDSAAYDRG